MNSITSGKASRLLWLGALVQCASSFTVAYAQNPRITEFTYSAASGEYIELTNVGAVALDLQGWSIDDVEAIPGAFDLSAAGLLGPGESMVVTTVPAADFVAAWGLQSSGVTVLGDNNTAKLSRTDAIHLFDPSGALVDRLGFSDITFQYSVRAKDISAWVCAGAIGQDDPYGWRSSGLGDGQGSTNSSGGDLGSPGSHISSACEPLVIGQSSCAGEPNSTGSVAVLRAVGDPTVSRSAFELRAFDLPANVTGLAVMGRQPAFIPMAGGSAGSLCVGPGLFRLLSVVSPSSALGEWTATLDLANPSGQQLPTVLPSQTWYFQLWYRDANPTPSSNFTTGWSVSFR